MHFKIEEYHKAGYPARTIYNVQNSDMTLAFATNFETAGELLTFNTCNQYGKRCVRIDLNNLLMLDDRVTELVKIINSCEAKILNIAGNGIYSLMLKQSEVDIFIYNTLKKITTHPLLKNRIELIRTGGQTGVDEAGARAGYRLAIQTAITAPKGFMFRGADSVDISDKVAFVARFDDCLKLVYPLPTEKICVVGGGVLPKLTYDEALAKFNALEKHQPFSDKIYIPGGFRGTMTSGFDFSEGGFREDYVPTPEEMGGPAPVFYGPEENINFPVLPNTKYIITITSRLAVILNKIRK